MNGECRFLSFQDLKMYQVYISDFILNRDDSDNYRYRLLSIFIDTFLSIKILYLSIKIDNFDICFWQGNVANWRVKTGGLNCRSYS